MPNGTDTDLVSMAEAFSGLPMEALIGAPLSAACEANHNMACDQANFLLNTCFNPGEGGTYNPIMISMKVTRPVITYDESTGTSKNESVDSYITLPLLTLLPLNSLAVQTVDVSFDMDVSSSYAENHDATSEESKHGDGSFSGSAKFGCFKVQVKGSVSYDSKTSTSDSTQYTKQNSACYKVAVHAEQLPLPPGVGIIIQTYANNVSPIVLSNNPGPNPPAPPSPPAPPPAAQAVLRN